MSIFDQNTVPSNTLHHSDTNVSHVALETMIKCEEAYRDTLVKQYQIMYPGLKYNDRDILKESLYLAKMTVRDFFKLYAMHISSQYNMLMSQMKTLYSDYTQTINSIKFSEIHIKPKSVNIPVFTYVDDIPSFGPLINAIAEVKVDYKVFTSNDKEEITNLITNISAYKNASTKTILNGRSVSGSDIQLSVYKIFKNNDAKTTVVLTDKFFEDLAKKPDRFLAYFKDIKNNVDRYVMLIRKLEKAFNDHEIMDCIDPDIVPNLEWSDPENMFYRYELHKLSSLLNVITPAIFGKLDMVTSQLRFNTSMLKQYSAGKGVIIPESEVY